MDFTLAQDSVTVPKATARAFSAVAARLSSSEFLHRLSLEKRPAAISFLTSLPFWGNTSASYDHHRSSSAPALCLESVC